MATHVPAHAKALRRLSVEYFFAGMRTVAQTSGMVMRRPAAKRESRTAQVPWRRTKRCTFG